jgi:hypothetical protein
MAKILKMRQGGLGQRTFQGGKTQPGRQRATDMANGRGLILRLDRPDQSLSLKLDRSLGIGMAGLAQSVMGKMRHRLQQGYQLLGPAPAPVRAQCQPVGGGGLGVAHAIFKPVMAPAHRMPQTIEWVGTGLFQAGQFAGHAVIIIIFEGFAQTVRGAGDPLPRPWLRQIEPDRAALDTDRVAPELIAAHQGFAGLQIEFPVVPVAGQNAPFAQGSHFQGIAFMGASVVAGVDLALALKNRYLFAPMLENMHALAGPQLLQGTRLHQALAGCGYACRHDASFLIAITNYIYICAPFL